MKVIRNQNEIVSLEGVRKVTLNKSGTGAKSNPFEYIIHVEYMNKEFSNLSFRQDGEKADKTMNEIMTILQAD